MKKDKTSLIASIICDEYALTQAERVAILLRTVFKTKSDDFSALTSGHDAKILVESHIQTEIVNALRHIELGMKFNRYKPAIVVKKKK